MDPLAPDPLAPSFPAVSFDESSGGAGVFFVGSDGGTGSDMAMEGQIGGD